jgi:hypothetical protein
LKEKTFKRITKFKKKNSQYFFRNNYKNTRIVSKIHRQFKCVSYNIIKSPACFENNIVKLRAIVVGLATAATSARTTTLAGTATAARAVTVASATQIVRSITMARAA